MPRWWIGWEDGGFVVRNSLGTAAMVGEWCAARTKTSSNMCAVVDEETPEAVEQLVRRLYPGFRRLRFLDGPQPPGWMPDVGRLLAKK